LRSTGLLKYYDREAGKDIARGAHGRSELDRGAEEEMSLLAATKLKFDNFYVVLGLSGNRAKIDLAVIPFEAHRAFILKPPRRSGTRGSSPRGSVIIGKLARTSPASGGLRQPLPVGRKEIEKSPLVVRSRLPWRSRMRRTAVDTRCTPLFFLPSVND